jgi:hypothetical protein
MEEDPMRQLYLLSGLLALTLLAACGTPASSAPLVDAALIERGVEVYRENYCGTCHLLSSAGTRGTFGPAHDDAGTQAAAHVALDSYSGTATSAAEYIRESLLHPGVFYTPGYEATNHHMPAFTHLSEADIEALVYMLVHE